MISLKVILKTLKIDEAQDTLRLFKYLMINNHILM